MGSMRDTQKNGSLIFSYDKGRGRLQSTERRKTDPRTHPPEFNASWAGRWTSSSWAHTARPRLGVETRRGFEEGVQENEKGEGRWVDPNSARPSREVRFAGP